MSQCKKCRAKIEWVEENGKWIPINVKTKDNHFKNCPYAKEFRGKRFTNKGKVTDKEQVSLTSYTNGS